MFDPKFTITPKLASILIRIEAIKQEVNIIPITPQILASLRESARISMTHYSTMIEGNRLTEEEVALTINNSEHFPNRERDEKEVLGYYVALDEIEKLATSKNKLTELQLKKIHGLVMSGGKKRVSATPYRDGQNVIRDSKTRRIVYLPPEPSDVPVLMKDLIDWINKPSDIPVPLKAGIAHYQYATIHPYYDGNGRTARLLTTLLLYKNGYGLKGLYSLEEYYANNLMAYYQALTIGPSHNYYFGRAEADITSWIEYFSLGMLSSFETIKHKALKVSKKSRADRSLNLNNLDIKKRKVLTLFQDREFIASKDIERSLKVHPRTARNISQQWVKEDFLIIADQSKKNRKYVLNSKYIPILKFIDE